MAASAAQKGVDSTTVIFVGSTFAQMDGVLKIGSAAAVVIQPPVPGHRLQRRNAAGLLCPRHSAGLAPPLRHRIEYAAQRRDREQRSEDMRF
jgi:hypothetical protein